MNNKNDTNTAQETPKSNQAGGPYAWYVVGVLIVAYTVSFIDRQILTLLVDPIRETFQISDFEISLLHGLAFAMFYSVLGIPIGRLVDQRRRTTIIATGVAIWSVMTACCGLAKNFVLLFIARIGVGVGEATLSPGAFSILSDYFPPKQLPRALSFYTGAAFVGAGVATMIGGFLIKIMPSVSLPFIGHLEPWQMVFIAVGLPGLVLAFWILTLREPTRTQTSPHDAKDSIPSISEVISYAWARRSAFGLVILGYSLSGTMWNGAIAWLPTYLIRTFNWSAADVGLYYGFTLMIGGTAGIILGGHIAAHMRERGVLDANIRIGLVSVALAIPSGLLTTLSTSVEVATIAMAIFLFATSMPYGGAAAALQEIAPNRMRGQISAIYLFFLTLFGIGLGPMFVATFTDLVFHDSQAIGRALASTIVIAGPLSAMVLWLARRPYENELRKVEELANETCE